MACGISAPQLEITPAPPALEASGLNPWATREVPQKYFLNVCIHAKAFDCVDHNKLWEILKAMGISDHLTCLLRNL